MSDDIRDLEPDAELEEQDDDVEGHTGGRLGLNDEPDDDFEAHIKLN